MEPPALPVSHWRLGSHETLNPGFLVSAFGNPTARALAEQTLKEVIAECFTTKSSDFDAVPTRPVSLNTGKGVMPGEKWGVLNQDLIVGMLAVLFSWKFTSTDPSAQATHMDQLEHQMLLARCADFGCTIPMTVNGRTPRVRVHAYLCETGLSMTCRVMAGYPPSPENLGLPEAVVSSLQTLLLKKSGLGLITGPTGSGKTSTLAAFLDHIRMNYPKKIVTIEDPIEILYDENGKGAVMQQEVGRDVSSFGDGLRSILRKRPDIILLGEIRDAEAMQTCLEATQTGHLVLATLHTRGVASTLRRITELFPAERGPQILSACADALLFVLSQGLLPRANGEGRTLACEFMMNKDSARPAISKFLSTPQALREFLRKPFNVEWNHSIRSLQDHNLIDERAARDAMMEDGSKADLE
ncbi:MAG: ATPase, T2SS/T4P/T4SS family [Verrucomicrobium sp.]|nr:ATPase, T2SS/T4P/T4SS family [Verrucomicrobium sp.]